MSLPERIRNRRHELRLTQLDLAKKLNMGRSNVGHIENGRTQPTSEVLSQIAEALSTSADYLLGRTDEAGPFTYPEGSMGWILSMTGDEYFQFFKENCSPVLLALSLRVESLKELVEELKKIFHEVQTKSFTTVDMDHEKLEDLIMFLEVVRLTFELNGVTSLDENMFSNAGSDDDNDDEEYVEYTEPDMIPLVGTICAGAGLLAEQNIEEYIYYPFSETRQPDFALRVKGDSMFDAGIVDGDIVFLRKAKWAEFNGQIVAAVVGEDGTLKRMKWSEGSPLVKLIPESKHYQTLEVWPNEIQVCGVYMGFFRPEDKGVTSIGFDVEKNVKRE